MGVVQWSLLRDASILTGRSANKARPERGRDERTGREVYESVRKKEIRHLSDKMHLSDNMRGTSMRKCFFYQNLKTDD